MRISYPARFPDFDATKLAGSQKGIDLVPANMQDVGDLLDGVGPQYWR